jgi:hypothetical protein
MNNRMTAYSRCFTEKKAAEQVDPRGAAKRSAEEKRWGQQSMNDVS